MDLERLQGIYEDLGKPGATIFRNAARRRGVDITTREAQQFVRGQSEKQVFADRLPSDGKAANSSREDSIWQLDLIDYSKKPIQKGTNYRYVLVAVDVHTRYLWIEPLLDKSDSEVLKAYRNVIRKNSGKSPLQISADMGMEFRGPNFQKYLKDNGTAFRQKNPQQINALSIVDRGNQTLKSIMVGLQKENMQWSQVIKKAESIYNDREHSALFGISPENVGQTPVAQYLLEAEAGRNMKHNNEKWKSKVGKIKDAGAFRVPLDRNTWSRIDQPKFSSEVYELSGLKGANVEDTDKNSYPVKLVLPVPRGSEAVRAPDELIPGSGRREQQKANLRPFSERLKNEMEGQEWSLIRVQGWLRAQKGFTDTAETYRLPKEGRVVAFLRLFGYSITGSGPTLRVKAPRVAAPAPSTPRGVDIAPRAQRADIPGETKIKFKRKILKGVELLLIGDIPSIRMQNQLQSSEGWGEQQWI